MDVLPKALSHLGTHCLIPPAPESASFFSKHPDSLVSLLGIRPCTQVAYGVLETKMPVPGTLHWADSYTRKMQCLQ